MEEAIQKADVLIEALQWIRQFRGKITVIKLGGSVMEDDRAMIHLLLDVVFMETVGMRPVVVHGGGAAISRAMAEAGLQPRFVQGRRYTDAATLAIVEKVLAGEVNERLARRIEELGGQAKPLNFRTQNVLFGERIAAARRNGESVDLGLRRHGDPRRSAGDRGALPSGGGAGHPLDVHRRKTGRSSTSTPTPPPPPWPRRSRPRSWCTSATSTAFAATRTTPIR